MLLHNVFSTPESTWQRIGIASSLLATALLAAEHFLNHGLNLNPVDHWLSEYVLSDLQLARTIIRLAFFSLATTAIAIASIAHNTLPKILFAISSLGLAAMAFFDSDPNDGRHYLRTWPPTGGNTHQYLLYVAIGAALLGIATMTFRSSHASSKTDCVLLGISCVAAMVQTVLVTLSRLAQQMTHYGGITERVLVLAVLVWAVRQCAKPRPNLGEQGS